MDQQLGKAGSLFADLMRLELVLFDRVDRQLRARRGLPLPGSNRRAASIRATVGFLRVREIADTLIVTVGGASKLIDRMEEAGHVQRKTDPDDRRVSRI